MWLRYLHVDIERAINDVQFRRSIPGLVFFYMRRHAMPDDWNEKIIQGSDGTHESDRSHETTSSQVSAAPTAAVLAQKPSADTTWMSAAAANSVQQWETPSIRNHSVTSTIVHHNGRQLQRPVPRSQYMNAITEYGARIHQQITSEPTEARSRTAAEAVAASKPRQQSQFSTRLSGKSAPISHDCRTSGYATREHPRTQPQRVAPQNNILSQGQTTYAARVVKLH
ncbi:hypothetical protein BJ742DRAFT_569212 [Cladochytrium replicatum]|nr:hypothetical protein BJ742DRAFT_569212 [Cladochytrium replicatum]